ncbi:sodium:calcium antiporter [Chelativorans sp. AA-79]|uniref:sodium:calcium antiporter n=1 Tax=Chelativorans sp. AA-79 TaxID=3028735 RepID=UPI0023F7ACCB|nr:sodium:calcium antiporter [Chelativorans sp. AA-79]WEX10233.1 sodium:calcium antiporter [Chelativorans sp. AA-79]
MPAFTDLPLTINLLLFAVAALVVMFAGARLSGYADAISSATGLGHAAVGLLLLAGVTSLPEIGVTVTATLGGNAGLALNNLFGSIAMQVALLAVVDFALGRRALTAIVPDPTVMLEGSLNVLLLAIVASGMVVGDILFLGAGLWSWSCLFGYVACVYILSREKGRKPWLAASRGKPDRELMEETERTEAGGDGKRNFRSLLLKTASAAAAILVAGFVVARTGEAIAEQSGLGTSFVGFVLVAISTSLPEASTALSAARHGYFTMAISDILGTNLINVGLVFLVDILSSAGPVLGEADTFATFGTLLAIVLTALFLAGLAERRDKSVLRMGYDSISVILVYAVGLVILFTLR